MSKVKFSEISELSIEELSTRLRDLKEEALNLRLQQATGQLENTPVAALFVVKSPKSCRLSTAQVRLDGLPKTNLFKRCQKIRKLRPRKSSSPPRPRRQQKNPRWNCDLLECKDHRGGIPTSPSPEVQEIIKQSKSFTHAVKPKPLWATRSASKLPRSQ